MELKDFFESKVFRTVILILAIAAVVMIVFSVGMMAGFKKADFSYRWSENYHRNFGGPRGGFMQEFRGRDFIDAHGTVGQIIKIEDNYLVIKGKDEMEKVIVIDNGTTIKRFRDDIKPADLKINDLAVIIGEPNNSGQILAKLIRLMPAPDQLPPPGDPRGFPLQFSDTAAASNTQTSTLK